MKMLLLLLFLIGILLMNVYCSKQTGSSSTKETITHHFFVSGIGRKTVDAAKICGGAENVKTETNKHSWKWIARFYYFRHLYSAGSACVLTIIAWVAHRYGAALYLHCSLIYFWVPSSCLHSDQPLSEDRNNPVQRCLPVGGGCIIHAGGGGGFALTDELLMSGKRRPAAASSHPEHHFQL